MRKSQVGAIFLAWILVIGNRGAYAQNGGYQVICPLFPLYETDEGWLTYCNGYQTSCNDIPDAIFQIWPVEPVPCDCPDINGCDVGGPGGWGFNSVIKPIASKVALDGRPKGLGAQVKVAKSVAAYFMKDDEPIYMCLFDFVLIDDQHLDHTRSLVMGIEMKSPATGIQGLLEIKDWQPTEQPYLFKTNHGGQVTYLVRAIGIAANDPKKVPTPAEKAEKKSHDLTSVRVQVSANESRQR